MKRPRRAIREQLRRFQTEPASRLVPASSPDAGAWVTRALELLQIGAERSGLRVGELPAVAEKEAA